MIIQPSLAHICLEKLTNWKYCWDPSRGLGSESDVLCRCPHPGSKEHLMGPGPPGGLSDRANIVLISASLSWVPFSSPATDLDLQRTLRRDRLAGKGKVSFPRVQLPACSWWSWPTGCYRCPGSGVASDRQGRMSPSVYSQLSSATLSACCRSKATMLVLSAPSQPGCMSKAGACLPAPHPFCNQGMLTLSSFLLDHHYYCFSL